MDGRAAIESIHKRIGHIVVPYKCYVLVWGGFNEVTGRTTDSTYCPADIVWFYNCHNGMWISAQTTGNIPEKTSGSSAAISDDYLYIFGGIVEPEEERRPQMHRNYLHRLHLPSLRWEKLLPRGSAPPSSDKGVGWAFNGRIYFFGGYGPRPDPSAIDFVFQQDFTNGRMGWNNNLFGYDPDNNSWFKPNTKGSTPDPRAAHAVSVMSGRAFIFGGRLGDSRTNDMYCLNMSTLTWSLNLNNPSTGPEGRSWLSFNFVSPKKAVVYGGLRQYGIAAMDYWECEFSDDYERLEWTKCVAPIEPRVWHQGAFCQSTGELIIIGGVSKSPYEMGEEDEHRPEVNKLELDSGSLLVLPPLDFMDDINLGGPESSANVTHDVFTKSSTSSPQRFNSIGQNVDAESNICDALNSADATELTFSSYNEDITQSYGVVSDPSFSSTKCSFPSVSSSKQNHELLEDVVINEHRTDGSIDSHKKNASTFNSIFETNLNNSFSYLETGQFMNRISFKHAPDSKLQNRLDEHTYAPSKALIRRTDYEKVEKNNAPVPKKRFCARAINFDTTYSSETQLDSGSNLIDSTSGQNWYEAHNPDKSAKHIAKGTALPYNRNEMSTDTIPTPTAAPRTYRVPKILVSPANQKLPPETFPDKSAKHIAKGTALPCNRNEISTDTIPTPIAAPRTHRVPKILVSPANQKLPPETSNLQPSNADFKTSSTPQKGTYFRCSSPVNIIKSPSFKSYITPENFEPKNVPIQSNSEDMLSGLSVKSSRSRRRTSNTLETPCSSKQNIKGTSRISSPSSLSSKGNKCKNPTTKERLKSKIESATDLVVTVSPLLKTAYDASKLLASPDTTLFGLSTVFLSAGVALKTVSESPLFQKS